MHEFCCSRSSNARCRTALRVGGCFLSPEPNEVVGQPNPRTRTHVTITRRQHGLKMAVGSFVSRSRTKIVAPTYLPAVGLPYDEPAAVSCRPGLTGSVAVLLGMHSATGVEGSASLCLNEFFRLIDRLLAGESSQRRFVIRCNVVRNVYLAISLSYGFPI